MTVPGFTGFTTTGAPPTLPMVVGAGRMPAGGTIIVDGAGAPGAETMTWDGSAIDIEVPPMTVPGPPGLSGWVPMTTPPPGLVGFMTIGVPPTLPIVVGVGAGVIPGLFAGGLLLDGGLFVGGLFTGGLLEGGLFTGGSFVGGSFVGGLFVGGSFTGGVGETWL